MFQAIAPNAFFVFAGTFPTNNAIANLLLGAPVTFYQGLGDFNRGVRVWGVGAYAQDEWRVGPRRDAELRPSLRAHQPVHRDRGPAERLRARRAVARSGPTRRAGWCFPATRASARASRTAPTRSCRASASAWDPTGDGMWSVRASYGLFYDQFQNGSGTASQVAISATPWAQFNQFSGAGLNFQNPYHGRALSRAEHVRAAVDGVRARRRREAAVRCRTGTSSVQRSLFDRYLVEVRYVGADGHATCRATSRRTRRSSVPAPRRRTPTAAASTPTARPTAAPAISRRSRCCGTSRSSQLSRRPGEPLAALRRRRRLQRVVLVLEVARLPVGDEPLRRRGQAARRRERPGAESVRPRRRVRAVAVRRAPSLRRQRELGAARCRPARRAAVRALFGGWQLNAIATHNSGTPFTVSDSANVALQANSPPISGFPASRPEPGRRSERRAAHRRRVDQPLGVPAAERPDAGRPVRQRRPQHRARAGLHQRRRVARARLPARRATTRLQFRAEVVQRGQPRQLRPAGRRPELAELRPDLLGRPAAADAVRAEADLLMALAPTRAGTCQ